MDWERNVKLKRMKRNKCVSSDRVDIRARKVIRERQGVHNGEESAVQAVRRSLLWMLRKQSRKAHQARTDRTARRDWRTLSWSWKPQYPYQKWADPEAENRQVRSRTQHHRWLSEYNGRLQSISPSNSRTHILRKLTWNIHPQQTTLGALKHSSAKLKE